MTARTRNFSFRRMKPAGWMPCHERSNWPDDPSMIPSVRLHTTEEMLRGMQSAYVMGRTLDAWLAERRLTRVDAKHDAQIREAA